MGGGVRVDPNSLLLQTPHPLFQNPGPQPTPFCYLHQHPVVCLVYPQVDFPASCAPYPILSPGHTLSLVRPPLWLTSLLVFHQWDTSSSLSLPRPIHQMNNLDWDFCLPSIQHTLPLGYHWAAVIDNLHLGLHALCWSSADSSAAERLSPSLQNPSNSR